MGNEVDQKVKNEIERYNALFNYSGPGKIIDWETYIKKREKENKSREIFQTGLIEFDGTIYGFSPGELVVITGLMGNGKTLFTKTLCYLLARQKIPINIFSYEDDALQYLEAFKGETDIPLYLPDENRPGSFKWLEERIIEGRVKFNHKIAIVDHLHYIVDMASVKISQDIGVVMRRLKMLAVEENMVIFIVCHQKSLPEGKSEPSLYTCRDSSAIPQECDMGLTIHRIPDLDQKGQVTDSYSGGRAILKVDKARRSGAYRKKIYLKKGQRWFTEEMSNQNHDN